MSDEEYDKLARLQEYCRHLEATRQDAYRERDALRAELNATWKAIFSNCDRETAGDIKKATSAAIAQGKA